MARTAILYIAERCNQSCVFCLEEDGTWNEFVDPSTQEVHATLAELRGRGAQHITFMGGETFFRKDLPRILAEARRLGFTRVGVTTNGTVISKPGFIGELVRAGLDFIEFSLHGHTRELANAIGGTHFTFERQAAALAELDALGSLFTIINVVICRENHRHLAEIARYVCEGFPRIPARFKFKFASMVGLALERARRGELLRHAEVDLGPAFALLAARGVPFWSYNVPLCRLGEHAAHSHELGTMVAGEDYFDFDHRAAPEYYDSGDQLEGRVWPDPPCGACPSRPLCCGVEEPYRLAAGELTGELRPRDDDGLALVAAALRSRGEDPGRAPARLADLRQRPRPARFVRARPEGALRFRREGAEEPLDLTVEARTEGPCYAASARFALGYRRWGEGDPGGRADVRALLAAAAEALAAADRAGLDLAGARAAVVAVAREGWRAEPLEPRGAPAKKKRLSLPVRLG